MKKILVLLSLCFCLMPITAFAEDTDDVALDTSIAPSIELYELAMKNDSVDLFYLNYTDHGVNYDIYSIGNNIDIFDADGSFLTRVTFSNSFVYDEKMFAKTQLDPINLFGIRASGLADQYNVFDTIGPVAGTTFTFNEHSLTYTLVMSALVAYCSQNYLYILEQVLDEITLQICSGQMAVVNVTFYYGYNKYCNILRLEAGSANSVRTNDYHYWTANPWDYATVDTPCRLLTEIYAY